MIDYININTDETINNNIIYRWIKEKAFERPSVLAFEKGGKPIDIFVSDGYTVKHIVDNGKVRKK